MAEFLLELFSEEIPARMQVKAANDLKEIFVRHLAEKGLPFTKAEAHSTPRRLTLAIDGLPEVQPDSVIDKKGPRIDSPQQAIDGFLRSIGHADLSRCVKDSGPKGEFWVYRENVKGGKTETVLADIITASKQTLPWPKSMKWACHKETWVRPLHAVNAVFGGKALLSNSVLGHRFLSSGSFEVSNFADYKTKLAKASVILDREDRKKIILDGAKKLADSAGLMIKEDEALIEEIVGLVEYPVPLMGTFEKEYLDVPQEVLISTMRGNQKYIALLGKDGKLSNKFIMVANTTTVDGGKQVIAGNEKVLRARLSDAKFFWDQDRRQKLESRNAALEHITFHKKLGSVKGKVDRLQTLSKFIADVIKCDSKIASRAALLSKADLTSGVVFQFPEVQGIMGRYYALHDKESPDVANAIADHYKPVGANDDCPTAPVSICVALADKLDTLAGFFAVDEKPTGSKDPFALRRAALGIIRIILENRLELPLLPLFEAAYKNYDVKGLKPLKEVSDELMQFFMDRLKVALKDKGIKHDLIDAVFAAPAIKDNLTEETNLAFALKDFLATENGANLLTAYKRGANIVRIEEKKDKKTYDAAQIKTDMMKEPQEEDLVAALTKASEKIKPLFEKKDFTGCMAALAEMRKPVDAFFDKILVNAPDENIRANRLCLLSGLRDTMNAIADFSKIEG